MARLYIKNSYFEWMYNIVCGDRYADGISYRKLLEYLHSVDFYYVISKDYNRSADGIDLRRRFAYEFDNPKSIIEELDGPCSVLEMMIALSFRCEEIMDDPGIGNRTGQWFWRMITNLGLGGMPDDRFDLYLANEVVKTFLDRKYEPDGRGGLFFIRNFDRDLRDVEIWIQMCYFLDTML